MGRGRRGTTRKRRRSSGISGALGTAQKALRIAQGVKALMNVEFKYKQTVDAGTAIDWNAVRTVLNNPPAGDGREDRDGDQIRVKRCVVNYLIQGPANNDPNGQLCRVMLVLSKCGGVPTLGDVLDVDLLATKEMPLAHKEYPDRKKHKILYNKYHSITSSTMREQEVGKINIPLDAVCIFEDGTATIADNVLTLWFLSDVDPTAAAGDKCSSQFVARCYYVDN